MTYYVGNLILYLIHIISEFLWISTYVSLSTKKLEQFIICEKLDLDTSQIFPVVVNNGSIKEA